MKKMGSSKQRGQALIFTLLFTAAAGLVGLMLFNSGLLANTKSRLQNAADAGAYSAGLLQARDQNFSAYTNRAMVANQVAVAQIVSIKSFLEDAADTKDRMGGILLTAEATIPTFKPVWTAQLKNPTIPKEKNLFDKLAPTTTKALDLLIRAFETAQDAHHKATAVDMVLVADEVIKRNDPLAKLSTGVFSVANTAVQVVSWDGYTKRHSANDTSAEADRFADVVVDKNSTDQFIRGRLSAPLAVWASVAVTPLCLPGAGVFTAFAFAHSGATQLSQDKKRWLGLDATMGGGMFSCVYITPFGPVTTVYPLIDTIGNSGWALGGSGGAVAGADGDYDSLNGYKNNPWTTKLFAGATVEPAGIYRYNWGGPGPTLDKSGGLQDYYRDVADPIGSIPKDQTPIENGGAFRISIEVERPASTIRTSSTLLPGSAEVKLDDSLAGNTMRALSSAHAYFYRPKANSSEFTRAGWARGDGKTEVANLFSPYWQTRLVDVSLTERVASFADQTK